MSLLRRAASSRPKGLRKALAAYPAYRSDSSTEVADTIPGQLSSAQRNAIFIKHHRYRNERRRFKPKGHATRSLTRYVLSASLGVPNAQALLIRNGCMTIGRAMRSCTVRASRRGGRPPPRLRGISRPYQSANGGFKFVRTKHGLGVSHRKTRSQYTCSMCKHHRCPLFAMRRT